MRRLTEADLQRWRAIPTAALSDERGHSGVLSGVRPVFAERGFAGQAITVTAHHVDNGVPRRALAEAWPGACMVLDARACGDSAVWGGNLISIARNRGVVAVVVDGNVRDVADLRNSGLAVYSRGITPKGPVWGGHIGGDVECGGVTIGMGDLLVGDEDGIIAIRLAEVTEELLGRCSARLAREVEERKE